MKTGRDGIPRAPLSHFRVCSAASGQSAQPRQHQVKLAHGAGVAVECFGKASAHGEILSVLK
jgi:hypothetical protein